MFTGMNHQSVPANGGVPGLVRGLTLLGAFSVVVGTVIGTGVFLKARVMTCNVETPGMVIGVFPL